MLRQQYNGKPPPTFIELKEFLDSKKITPVTPIWDVINFLKNLGIFIKLEPFKKSPVNVETLGAIKRMEENKPYNERDPQSMQFGGPLPTTFS